VKSSHRRLASFTGSEIDESGVARWSKYYTQDIVCVIGSEEVVAESQNRSVRGYVAHPQRVATLDRPARRAVLG
jgi:hypothetical protein